MSRASIYRPIAVCMHNDEKFLDLSAPPPNARTLWVHLLTGPETGPIPGLFVSGFAGLAESLGWAFSPYPEPDPKFYPTDKGKQLPKQFREQFRERFISGYPGGFETLFEELSSKGMVKADWDKRIVWVPNAIFYRFPKNQNIVKGWIPYLEILPRAELVAEALTSLIVKIHEGRNPDKEDPCLPLAYWTLKQYPEQFLKQLPKQFLKQFPKQSLKQEKEKEKEKEKDLRGEFGPGGREEKEGSLTLNPEEKDSRNMGEGVTCPRCKKEVPRLRFSEEKKLCLTCLVGGFSEKTKVPEME